MKTKILPVENPAVLDAVKKLNETATQEGYFAFTTVWTVSYGHLKDVQHSNFTSGLIGNESLEWGLAEALFVKAQEYGGDPCNFAQGILSYAQDLEDYRGDDSAVTFDGALENFRCLVNDYDRFRCESNPSSKTFYSDFEEEAYNEFYAKTCAAYEEELGKAARKMAKLNET